MYSSSLALKQLLQQLLLRNIDSHSAICYIREAGNSLSLICDLVIRHAYDCLMGVSIGESFGDGPRMLVGVGSQISCRGVGLSKENPLCGEPESRQSHKLEIEGATPSQSTKVTRHRIGN